MPQYYWGTFGSQWNPTQFKFPNDIEWHLKGTCFWNIGLGFWFFQISFLLYLPAFIGEILFTQQTRNVFWSLPFGGNEKGKNKPGNMGDLLQYHLVRMNATLKSPLAWGWFRLTYNGRISTVEFSQNRFVAGLKMWDAVVCLGHHPGTEWWEKPAWDPPTEYEWRYSYIIPSKRLLRKGMDIRIDKMGISY